MRTRKIKSRYFSNLETAQKLFHGQKKMNLSCETYSFFPTSKRQIQPEVYNLNDTASYVDGDYQYLPLHQGKAIDNP